MTKSQSPTSATCNWALCLGGGEAQLPLILAAKLHGLSVCVVDRNEHCAAYPHADKFIQASTYDPQPLLAMLNSIELPIRTLLARTSGPALYTAAAIDEKLNLFGLSQELVALCTIKSRLREYCEANHIPVPKGTSSKHPNQPSELPVVVRPDFPLSGKKAVTLCTHEHQLKPAIESAKAASADGTADIACFIEGNDISLLAHLDKGCVTPIAWWDELNQFNQGELKAVGLLFPTQITESIKVQLIDAATRFAKSFPDLDYLLAFSFRIDKQQQARLIEVHADLTGDLILDRLIPAAAQREVLPDIVQGLLTRHFPDFTKGKLIPTAIRFEEDGPRLYQDAQLSVLLKLFNNTKEPLSDE
ncbi:hypothetical protein L1D40_11890 [Shewanella insulae]|uniref:hypothetical protein n=1 Tax=Shewanella insulae TaxID=2681496 RepID=UPI001EFE3777|nr:hypothetical protein [Shewanella insulae]MCG9713269.1 hypothetical protein [Shewanella insulae]MCG9755913.1 hypothetical protein [Shewanella insulae]